MPGYSCGTEVIPSDWSRPDTSPKIPLFWWKRKGIDASFAPIAFIHGGPASSSWGVLEKWKELLANYPGDFVSFDHRGEGCSQTLVSNLSPDAYSIDRARKIIQDMEFPRSKIFKYSQWRVVGHSRGVALVLYYLEMAPSSLESAGLCWFGIEGYKYCGSGVIDVLGVNNLKYVNSYSILHGLITSMPDAKTIQAVIAKQLLSDPYGHFNYIVGTNSRDMAGPDSLTNRRLRDANDAVFAQPFLAEVRYVSNTVAPNFAATDWRGSVDQPNYYQILWYLATHPNFKYKLFIGEFDLIAPPELYEFELEFLHCIVRNFTEHGS
jgi:pimeloyl-ACP methyl ester carboxylesterase